MWRKGGTFTLFRAHLYANPDLVSCPEPTLEPLMLRARARGELGIGGGSSRGSRVGSGHERVGSGYETNPDPDSAGYHDVIRVEEN